MALSFTEEVIGRKNGKMVKGKFASSYKVLSTPSSKEVMEGIKNAAAESIEKEADGLMTCSTLKLTNLLAKTQKGLQDGFNKDQKALADVLRAEIKRRAQEGTLVHPNKRFTYCN
jgi:hypothetical protein